MLIELSWRALMQECLSQDPDHNPDRATDRAIQWLEELNSLDQAWRENQRRFYDSGDLVLYGVAPDEPDAALGPDWASEQLAIW